MRIKYKDITEEQKKDIILIDPYMNNKGLCNILNMCENTIIKLRKYIGLNKRKNGRPFKTTYLDIIEQNIKGYDIYPEQIQQAILRLKQQFK